MKLKVNLSGAAIGDWFAHNGEKLVLAVVVLVFVGFLYGAATSKPLDANTSSNIQTQSQQAQSRIREVSWDAHKSTAPDLNFTTAAIEPAGDPAETQAAAFEQSHDWNPPLFPELVKRAAPDIYPVEELRIATGWGIVPYTANAVVAAAPGAGRPPRMMGPPPGMQMGPSARDMPPEMQGGMPAGPQGIDVASVIPGVRALNANPQAKYFAVVTGVVAVEKQYEEYRRRFQYAVSPPTSTHLDVPSYVFFFIERAEVSDSKQPDADLQWKRLDYKQPMADKDAWADSTTNREIADPNYVFPNIQGSSSHLITWPLPPLYLKDWGLEAIHPRIPLNKPADADTAPVGTPQDAPDPLAASAARDSGYATGEYMGQGGPPAYAGGPPQGGGFRGPRGMSQEAEERPKAPRRLFRYVDLTAEPGKTYRYRVQLVLHNPNLDMHPQYLAKADLAKGKFLNSPWSEPSPAATVPSAARLLASGAAVLRSAVTEPMAKLRLWTLHRNPIVVVEVEGQKDTEETKTTVVEMQKDDELPLGGVGHFREQTFEDVIDMAVEQRYKKVAHVEVNANQAMLLDLRNDEPLGASKSKGPTEMLFVDGAGRLFVETSASDHRLAEDYKQRTNVPGIVAAEPIQAEPAQGPPGAPSGIFAPGRGAPSGRGR